MGYNEDYQRVGFRGFRNQDRIIHCQSNHSAIIHSQKKTVT